MTPAITPVSAYAPQVLVDVRAIDSNQNVVHELAAPITISITFRPAAGVNGRLAKIYTVNDQGATQELQTTVVDNWDGTFTATAVTWHLSPFQVFAPSAGTVVPLYNFPLVANSAPFIVAGW